MNRRGESLCAASASHQGEVRERSGSHGPDAAGPACLAVSVSSPSLVRTALGNVASVPAVERRLGLPAESARRGTRTASARKAAHVLACPAPARGRCHDASRVTWSPSTRCVLSANTVRAVASGRLVTPLGNVGRASLAQVREVLALILDCRCHSNGQRLTVLIRRRRRTRPGPCPSRTNPERARTRRR